MITREHLQAREKFLKNQTYIYQNRLNKKYQGWQEYNYNTILPSEFYRAYNDYLIAYIRWKEVVHILISITKD